MTCGRKSERSAMVSCLSQSSARSEPVHHRWGTESVGVELVEAGDSVTLEIGPWQGAPPSGSPQPDARALRLRAAAELSLDLDATSARLVRGGSVARLSVKPPRRSKPRRVSTAEDASLLRPRVEELVAPLLFSSPPQATLRPFQESGVQWLTQRRAGILADDMGLGKTVQALVALQSLIVGGTVRSAVIVCPKSLLANWEEECGKWVPGLTVVRSVPDKHDANDVWSAILGRSHIVVTSYEQFRNLPRALRETPIDLLIADEAHRLRRSQTRLVTEFRRLTVKRFWALTGTPIERHPVDLATLLSLLEPTRFSVRSASSESGLRNQAEPYILRRLKQDVLQDLPDVIETKETIELAPKQRRAYTKVQQEPFAEDVGGVLQKLNVLRSICDVSPEDGTSSKIDRIIDILRLVQETGEKAVVFSYLLRPLEILERRMLREEPPLVPLLLTGELAVEERDHVLRAFKSDSNVLALLCSSRVGGEGLTLTEANHVIFINEWWNPSANAQARDRVVRLGQKRLVHVHRFRCRNTVEEILDLILEEKSETFADIVDALATQVQLGGEDVGGLVGEALGRVDLPE